VTKSIAILGAGESGVGAALLAKKLGYDIWVSDKSEIKDHFQKELMAADILFESGHHNEGKILDADLIVVSPGIPLSIPMLIEARDKGIQTISEIEFAARHSKATLIGISGTNGKTTTTSLTYHILKKAGLDVACGGNIGQSFARILSERDYEYVVLELSSFQLDGMFETKLDYAILLNITPDHLDRYKTLDNYIESKFRLLNNQDESCKFIYCADDPITAEHIKGRKIRAEQIPISLYQQNVPGAWSDDQMLYIQLNQPNNQFKMNLNQITIGGKHNTYNSMAAGIVANSLLIRNDIIRESLMDFKNVEHRLENVGKVKGIEFINDSKATNVNAVWYALESMENPIIWIAGGVDKGNEYQILEKLVAEKVRVLICMGKNNIPLHQAFAKHVDMIVNTSSADEAVKTAFGLARTGETVLLSPACASFDLFENYEDRGRQFKLAVRNL
jgi:UDP-N-acetylmuramoylalanine--D-glutamate ligase